MSFNVTLQRNANRNNAMLGAYPNGDAPEITGEIGEYYVGPDGDNSDGLTRATAFTDIDTAIPLLSNGETIVVLDGYVGGIWTNLLAQNAGTNLSRKTITGEYPNTQIFGGIGNYPDYTGTSEAYWNIERLLFMQQPYEKARGNTASDRYPYGAGASAGGGHQNTTDDLGCVSDLRGTQRLAFFLCGWYGSSQNGKNLVWGDHQCFDYCYAFGGGARYMMQGFEVEETVLRQCVSRSDEGWLIHNNNPWGVIQDYSSNNDVMIQCIVVDSLPPDTSAGPVSGINVTFKAGSPQGSPATASSTSGNQIECLVSDHPTTAYQYETSGAVVYSTNTGSISRRANIGIYGRNQASGSELYIDGCDIRGSLNRGVYNNYNTLMNVVDTNAYNNTGANYSVNSGNSATLTEPGNTNTELGTTFNWQGIEKRGVIGTFKDDVNHDAVQSGEYWFGVSGSGMAYEDVMREAFLLYVNPYSYSEGIYSVKSATAGTDADRGFCGNDGGGDPYTLTGYLWRDD